MRLPLRRHTTPQAARVACLCQHRHEADNVAIIGPYVVCRCRGCWERVLMATRVGEQLSLFSPPKGW